MTKADLLQVDRSFVCASAKAANARVKYGVPAWRYHYSATNPSLFIKLLGLGNVGATHLQELPLVFGMTTDPQTKIFQDAWGAFARNPTSGLSQYGWPTYNASSKNTLKQPQLEHY